MRATLIGAAIAAFVAGCTGSDGGIEFRTMDGAGNNMLSPERGAAGTSLVRMMNPDYSDGMSGMSGAARPGPREISNAISKQDAKIPNSLGASDMLWQWGQFLDHDITLTPEDPGQPADIPVPAGDPDFDPLNTGTVVIPFIRSTFDPATGTDPDNPRNQPNVLTAFIDASNVYGSDDDRARGLRTLDGTGRLKTSAGDLLPFNTDGFENFLDSDDPTLFLAGDVRCNEQLALTAMHTLWMREHNRLAQEIAATTPGLTGDQIYYRARGIVGALMQVITYNEFLPLLLGPGALEPYAGYDAAVDPGIAAIFSTACYRLGHTLLSSRIRRIDAAGNEIAFGHLTLREAFFRPDRLAAEGGIDPIFRGLASQLCNELDVKVIEDVRSFLFGPPGAGGLDLIAFNLQRGRDHAIPSYNDTREGMGLARKADFAAVSSDPAVQAALASVYASVDDIDLWIGAMAEDHLPGAMVGELLMAVLKDQFERLRDGDRFWYQRVFQGAELAELEATRLSDVIRRNTTIGVELADDVFRAPAGP